ncbi:hypothetical protein [Lacrimispora brassicae]
MLYRETRKLSGAVAYGPGIPGQARPGIPGYGYGHQPDYCVNVDCLIRAVEIYVEAILALDASI